MFRNLFQDRLSQPYSSTGPGALGEVGVGLRLTNAKIFSTVVLPHQESGHGPTQDWTGKCHEEVWNDKFAPRVIVSIPDPD